MSTVLPQVLLGGQKGDTGQARYILIQRDVDPTNAHEVMYVHIMGVEKGRGGNGQTF
jgi:hypothetical protein